MSSLGSVVKTNDHNIDEVKIIAVFRLCCMPAMSMVPKTLPKIEDLEWNTSSVFWNAVFRRSNRHHFFIRMTGKADICRQQMKLSIL